MIYLRYFKYIILIFTSFIFYFFIREIGLNGHDSFQYIEWSNKIFTDPNLTFNRPVLYTYINILNSILKWPYFGLGFSNLVAFIFSSFFIFKIFEILKFDEVIKIASYITFLCSSLVINSFKNNYIANIEILFLLILVFFSLLILEKKEKKIIYLFHGIFSSLIFFIHEEKIIISFLIYIFILICLKKKNLIIYSFLSFLITTLLIFLIFVNEISLINYLRVSGSASAGEQHLIFNNFILNLIYSLNVNVSYLTNIFIPIIIYILFFKKIRNIKLNIKFFLYISLGYLFLLTLIIGQPEHLVRTYGVCFVLANFIMFSIIKDFNYNYPTYKIFTYCLIFILLVPMTLNFYKIFFVKDYKNKYILAYKHIKKNFNEKDTFVLELPSFEKRTDMWDRNRIYGYGLSSVVYFGKKSINLNALKFKFNKSDDEILSEINKFNQVVLIKKETPEPVESEIIKKLSYNSNKWNRTEISKNLIIFNKVVN